MLINQISATATIDLVIWIPIIGFVVTILMNIGTIFKVRQENKDKMATKDYVNDKLKPIEKDVSRIEDDLKTQENKIDGYHSFLEKLSVLVETVSNEKKQNEKEHKEFKDAVKEINKNLNTLIQQKSA